MRRCTSQVSFQALNERSAGGTANVCTGKHGEREKEREEEEE